MSQKIYIICLVFRVYTLCLIYSSHSYWESCFFIFSIKSAGIFFHTSKVQSQNLVVFTVPHDPSNRNYKFRIMSQSHLILHLRCPVSVFQCKFSSCLFLFRNSVLKPAFRLIVLSGRMDRKTCGFFRSKVEIDFLLSF